MSISPQPLIPQTSVQVIIRLQPPSNPQIQQLNLQTLQCVGKQYNFDYIFPPTCKQQEIYEKIGMKMIASVKKGYNCCIFAYGQTGSGKTYTMTGTENQDGLIQRCVRGLLSMLEGFESYEIKLSYFEIYNQQVNDLLVNCKKKEKQKNHIKIKQSLTLGFYLENLQEIKVEGISDLLEQLDKGIRNRTTAQTKMNRQSSRSHSILTLFITTRKKKDHGEGFSIKSSKMHFVDLAGSQKQKSTLAAGDRLKQASSINKSLTSLSIVIEKLSAKATHIPYRDSVLTKILRDSLGGNSKTMLIATLSSKDESISQSVSTLLFATKAKKVKLSARINQQYDGSVTQLRNIIKQLQQQIKQLKNKENDQKCQNCSILKQQYENIRKQVHELEQKLQYKQNEIQNYIQILDKMTYQHQIECSQYMKRIDQLQQIIKVFKTTHQNQGFKSNFNVLDSLNLDNEVDRNMEENDSSYFAKSPVFSAYNPSLSVILEQSMENQPQTTFVRKSGNQSLSEISLQQFQQQSKGKHRQRFHRQKPTITKNPLQTSPSSYQQFQYQSQSQQSQPQQVQRLTKKIEALQKQLQRHKMEQNFWQNTIKIEEQNKEKGKQLYEPFIKNWIENNGNIIKSNLKARNAVQMDIMLTLRNRNKQLKKIMEEKEMLWRNRVKELEEFISSINNRDNLAKNQYFSIPSQPQPQPQKDPNNPYLSKSHPRMQQHHHQLPSILPQSPKQQQIQQPPLPTLQHLQQQLDRQQLIQQQLNKKVEDYKLKYESLESQIEQNRTLASYWENKYNVVVGVKREIQDCLEDVRKEKLELMESLDKIKKQDQIAIKQQHKQIQQIPPQNNYIQQLQYEINNKTYQLQHQQQRYDKISRQLQKTTIQLQKTSTQLQKIRNSCYNTQQQNNSLKQMLQSMKISTAKLENEQKLRQQSIHNLQMQSRKQKQNNSYIVQKYKQELKQKQKQLKDIQKQSSKQYLEYMQIRDKLKLQSMKYTELMENYKKVKQHNQQLQLKNKDLHSFITQDQSQYYRAIHRLNEENTNLKQELELRVRNGDDLRKLGEQVGKLMGEVGRLVEEGKGKDKELEYMKQKQVYLTNQYNQKVNQVQYWRQQSQKQRKWSQDFKKMQQQFLTTQKQPRQVIQRNNKPSISDRPNIKNSSVNPNNNLNTSITSTSRKDMEQNNINSLNSWEYIESKRQIGDIADRLGQICGIEVSESNLILKMDEIGEKIRELRMLKEDNKSLRAKNKILAEQRNSDFWKQIKN